MCETLIALLPLLGAFLLDRLIEWRNRRRARNDFLLLVRDELEEIEERLTGRGKLASIGFRFKRL